MAEKLEIVISAKDEASKTLGKVKGELSDVGSRAKGIASAGLKGVGIAAGVAAAAVAAVGAAAVGAGVALVKLGSEGAKLEQTETTFERLSENIGATEFFIDDLRKATRGMVSDSELMAAANKLVIMGLADTQTEAAKTAEMATQLGAAMGKDATASMEEWSLMMANQSIPRLDTFGISSAAVRQRIDELMESTAGLTREAAFNQAVMEQGAIAMEKVGEQGGGSAASIERLKAQFKNMGDSLKMSLAPALAKLTDVLSGLMTKYGPQLQVIFEKVGAALAEWFEDVLPKVVDWFVNKLIPAILNVYTWITTKLIPGVKRGIQAWKDTVAYLKILYNEIKNRISLAYYWVVDFMKRIVESVRQGWQDAKDWVVNAVKSIGDWIKNLWNSMVEGGRNIVEGIRTGISNAWNSFKSWVLSLLAGFRDTVLGFFGIQSPSSMFAEIGANLMTGLAQGIGSGLTVPVTAMVQAGGALTSAATSTVQNHYNLTINSQARVEQVTNDFMIMKSLAGA